MRTSVDLGPEVRRRVEAIAERTGASLSATIAELTVRGLAILGEPLRIDADERSGFPVVSLGRKVTSAEVGALLDEE